MEIVVARDGLLAQHLLHIDAASVRNARDANNNDGGGTPRVGVWTPSRGGGQERCGGGLRWPV